MATWLNIPEYPDVGSNTFQAVLWERYNMIQFSYLSLDTDGFSGTIINVGIDSNTGLYINSASGRDIPQLESSDIFYIPIDNVASNYYQSSHPVPDHPVPEPASILLMALGGGAIFAYRLRKRSK
ncbi:PEP-CTERM sorting domain-containing protein [Thermodesulfatator autotrophicus]|uniref:Ice-binding protein C-terminal domain-containing protein n=1 Tax=Thermodesulfatator autotrophicus TaxID=1795632 RepID=A0A177E8F6_9BACT|nr:PEP-CTERM sorting domain-containing protein [Thermodesulfatator autotrophicus]OAG27700.1 hypothetical protein TH606_05760 [Thermodesulfatator autotrophicus]